MQKCTELNTDKNDLFIKLGKFISLNLSYEAKSTKFSENLKEYKEE